ncbi:glutamate receptor: ionotropic kainate 3-like protein 2 [Dinothrombium tinctorium]|uniref:Glutamate receptor: ionotropic kainate 3-like protein 2 n=1 Tax=Dinothrombium tinctorium TaxID=1965070 RepID=A0A443REE5_9ACAR|nr:glutamate receptor: ionotropic kainate 3-like protein 2 [Dinothrombium tinctorium]
MHFIKCLPGIIRIGALFNENQQEEKLALKIAVERINSDMTLIAPTKLIETTEAINNFDSFISGFQTCSMLKNGASAIFGPLNDISAMHVRSICDSLEVPHIEVLRDFKLHNLRHSINFHPHPSILSHAFIDLITALNWKRFAIAYEDSVDVLMASKFLNDRTFGRFGKENKNWKIMRMNEYNILIDVRTENLYQVLKEAQQIGILTQKYNFIITSLDLHTIDLEDFKYSKATILSFSLLHKSSPELLTLLHSWDFHAKNFGENISSPVQIKTSTALIYDSVKHFVKAIKAIDVSTPINRIPATNHSDFCNDMKPWKQGTSVINQMLSTESSGITGRIHFSQQRYRSLFTLHLQKLDENGLRNCGKCPELSLLNVGGVFIVLIFGFAVAIILAFVELVYCCRKWDDPELSLCEKIKEELRFALNFKEKLKKNRKKESENGESEKTLEKTHLTTSSLST